MAYTTSAEGRNRIANDEGGYKLRGYKDCKGVPTIGAGHTGKVDGQVVYEGMVISREKAEQLFNNDIKRFEKIVNDAVKVPLTQRWFDALVNFTYINGHIKGTKLLAAVNNQDWATATQELSIEKIHEPRMKRWRAYVSGNSALASSTGSTAPAYNYDYEAIKAENAKTELALAENSKLRQDLFDFVNAVDDDGEEQPKNISISMKEVDVTGSTSVWGIS